MILQGIYLKTFQKLGRGEFDLAEFSKINKISPQSAKVLVHRLKQNRQLFKSGYGRYVLLSPKSWVTLEGLTQKPKLYEIAVTLYEMFPKLGMLLLYGSQVRGDADRYSDYDVLVVNDAPVENVPAIRRKFEGKLGIRLHLTVYSEHGFGIFAITEPYFRFWFNEGILFDEKGLVMNLAKPVARMAYLENLEEARMRIGMLSEERDRVKRAKHAFTALRISLLIEHALALDYRYNTVSDEIKDKIGGSVYNIRAKKPLRKKELGTLEQLSKTTFRRVSEKVDALGNNESDMYWRKSIGGGYGQKERT